MTLSLAIGTFAGGFIFPFLIKMLWDEMVDSWGPAGGYMAAGFIVGTTWTLAHGIEAIYQTGAWVDMAFGAGVGCLAYGIVMGESFGKAVPTIISSIIGGTLGGFILSTFL